MDSQTFFEDKKIKINNVGRKDLRPRRKQQEKGTLRNSVPLSWQNK